MARQCADCGTVYNHDEAEYCNVCGSENLVPVIDPPSPPARQHLRDDTYSLAVATLLWLSGVSYVVGHREPRSWPPLAFAWLFLTLASLVAGLVLKNVRTFVAFSGFGALLFAVYALVKLT